MHDFYMTSFYCFLLDVPSRDGTDNKKCIRMLRCVRKLCPHAAPHRIQTQLSLHCTVPHHKLIIFLISTNIGKKLALKIMTYKKIDFWSIILESFQKSCSLKPCQNICFLNICRYKKSNALA